MSSATENGRIKLTDRLQRKWFEDAMQVLRDNYASLSDYDRRIYNDLNSAYDMVGQELTVTRKQMNHIKTSAASYIAGA